MGATASFVVTHKLADPKNFIYQVSKHLTENKNLLLILIKLRWSSCPRFRSHMKTDNANRLTDPQNLYL